MPSDSLAPGRRAGAGRRRAPHSLRGILDGLHRLARQGGAVQVGDMVGLVGARSYGPFLVLPALLEISPIGAVPGVPTTLAVFIVLVAGQLLLGRPQLWLPRFVARASIDAQRLRVALVRLRPLARRLDGWFHGRLQALTSGPLVRVAALACIALACLVPPLDLLPFASSGPMLVIAMIGLALLVRDGLVMLLASALVLLAPLLWMRVA